MWLYLLFLAVIFTCLTTYVFPKTNKQQMATVWLFTLINPFNNDVIRRKELWKQSLFMTSCRYITSLRATRVNMRFLCVLGRGQHIFKDSVRLITRF